MTKPTPSSASSIKTHILGYPRIGEKRELKLATEAYWKGEIDQAELLNRGRALREQSWRKQADAGIGLVAVNDFSFYDQTLDMSCLLGNVPPRFRWKGGTTDVDTVFTIARGTQGGVTFADEKGHEGHDHGKVSTFASEMTKWFDTNYHYIVPEFYADTKFALSGTKVFDEFAEAKALGFKAKPVLVGPVTYLSIGKAQEAGLDPFSLLDNLLGVYEQIVGKLAAAGAEWIQLDEPVFSTDLSSKQRAALKIAYERLSKAKGSAKVLVTTFFGGVRDNLDAYLALPVDALHFDFVRGSEDVETVLVKFPKDKILSAGLVEGRNIWKNNYDTSLAVLAALKAAVGADRLWVAPSCSLQHAPVTLANEPKLDDELKNWLAFADQKLAEVADLRNLLDGTGGKDALAAHEANKAAAASRKTSKRIHNDAVKSRLAAVKAADYDRASAFAARQVKQADKLKLPEFPTTTIGSFPQTKEVRQARAQWKKGLLSEADYDKFLKEETKKCVEWQDAIGIDMPVHGEFERNDMVEYFGENLEGFVFTQSGWVQSYGSRYVKPPVIFGDVSRPKPMTVYWSQYAQSLTKRPMKGMLTGPVTILQWSFVRDDQPRSVTTHQIGLAIRDEVVDLERAGIAAIQIDEPAIREGLPLRRSDWEHYLNWAVKGFRLSASGVKDDTQIHTHMCYSEFNDIIKAIADMDADVITIETSRSNMELLQAFVGFKYPNEIGPGVYDIHSPRVPNEEEMVKLMKKAEAVLPRRNLWVNPDCGLKTRGWAEVKPALQSMVTAAHKLRASAAA